MTLHCDWCCVLIEHDNRRTPGFCGTACYGQARRERDRAAADQAQRRRDRAQQAEWLTRAKRPHYLT